VIDGLVEGDRHRPGRDVDSVRSRQCAVPPSSTHYRASRIGWPRAAQAQFGPRERAAVRQHGRRAALPVPGQRSRQNPVWTRGKPISRAVAAIDPSTWIPIPRLEIGARAHKRPRRRRARALRFSRLPHAAHIDGEPATSGSRQRVDWGARWVVIPDGRLCGWISSKSILVARPGGGPIA